MARDFYPGMGQAVAERTILRKVHKGSDKERWETWGEVAERVAEGNASLCKTATERVREFKLLNEHIGEGRLLTSGRHLQHGDVTQADRNMEVFTNCSTSITTFGLVYLLLNGSGVGRCYDDDLMLVDWDNAPNVLCVIDSDHPDFDNTLHESSRDARHKYAGNPNVIWYDVPDSREGWGQATEYLEILAFEKIHRDKLLILNFSKVRCKNSPIRGMQDRPSSGPVPLMNAFARINSIKGSGMPRWKQAMYIDHYLAEVVMMGGVRRSARMSTKYWKDASIFDFIDVKRPIEFEGKTWEEIAELRRTQKPQSFLWSSNNSVMVDKEFWDLLALKKRTKAYRSALAVHARKVFKQLTERAYYDGTGEPGIINVDQLSINQEGLDSIKGEFFGSKRYQTMDGTSLYMEHLLRAAKKKQYCMIVNPCGEICIAVWGAFCTIADVCFYFCDSLDQCEEVVRAAVRFLIRTNSLDSVYNKEVARTQRIGVGLTGIHEAAWKFFGLTFHDLLDEHGKAAEFWKFIARMRAAVRDEALSYSKKRGIVCPHTDTTVKPSGTISKLFGLTEGWHLPSMIAYIRWVQFSENSPMVAEYRAMGYPVQTLKSYKGSVIVGFPTVPLITTIMPAEKLVTAAQATPEEQYQWLMLGERYWVSGDTGNQISYTLKYDPKKVSYKDFAETILKYQSKVKACSVMPQEDESSYEYLPEQPVSHADYLAVVAGIKTTLKEDIGREHLECAGGQCPVDFNSKA